MTAEVDKVVESMERLNIRDEQKVITTSREPQEGQKSEDSDDVSEESENDDQESPGHPAYVPRGETYFMHDLRNVGDHPLQSPKHRPSRADKKWEHDLYDEVMQAPKFPNEIVRRYGSGKGIQHSPDKNVGRTLHYTKRARASRVDERRRCSDSTAARNFSKFSDGCGRFIRTTSDEKRGEQRMHDKEPEDAIQADASKPVDKEQNVKNIGHNNLRGGRGYHVARVNREKWTDIKPKHDSPGRGRGKRYSLLRKGGHNGEGPLSSGAKPSLESVQDCDEES